MIRNVKNVTVGALAMALVLGVVGIASSDVIKERQEAMSSIREAMGALAAIAKGEAPFDAAVVAKSAGSIEDHLREAGSLFPEGSDKGDAETWAKAEIWSDYADFVMKLEKSQAAAAALKGVSEESAFRPAMGKLGSSCKACHTDYRRPKN